MRKTPLTIRQEEVLNYIRDFIEEHDYPPTLKEIQKFFKFSSSNSAVEHLMALERKKYIRRIPKVARGIRVLIWDD